MADMTPKQIQAALKAGIINDAQAAQMLGTQPDVGGIDDFNVAQIGNEDDARFLRSFSDVFITIGIAILTVGLFMTIGLFGGGVGYLVGAAVLWGMCEYFGRVKRAHLPTLFLALGFLIFTYTGLSAVIDFGAHPTILPALMTVIAMLLFYLRFRLPFAIALIAISLIVLTFALVGDFVPAGLLMLISGLALFFVGIWYDTHDMERKTRFADNAFWLHFTAAPLIIHGFAALTFSPKITKIAGMMSMMQLERKDAAALLVIIALLALAGLLINRRALLVSSLGYAAIAIAFLLKDTGLKVGAILSITLLLLGAGVLFLGVGWHGARKILLRFVPKSGFFCKVFPPEPPRSPR